MKIHPTVWEEVFAIPIFNKGLISRIYRKTLKTQVTKNKTGIPSENGQRHETFH